MKEVQLKRFAGPFSEPPFQNYIQSPLGLVPKDNGSSTRLIFHLSNPRIKPTKDNILPQQRSVNANTPKEKTKVEYPDFEQAVRMILKYGPGAYLGKSDFKSAFRNLGIFPGDWMLLVMKATSPLDGKTYYFVDKCLPFGASISCSHFQRFSNAVAHIFRCRTQSEVLNYLDDFFFVALLKVTCDSKMKEFLMICQIINFPVSEEKTYWGTTQLSFLGLLINMVLYQILIPREKVQLAQDIIMDMLARVSKKKTLKELQRLCGILNFFDKCIIPARTFTRRLYAKTAQKERTLKPGHHIAIDREMRLDLELWLRFFKHPTVFSRKITDFDKTYQAEDIHMYSDSSRNPLLGCGGVCQSDWFSQQWDKEFMEKFLPSIEYLELYAVAVMVVNWIHKFRDQKISLFCDNMSVVYMINNGTSSCKNCMVLLRIVILYGILNNTIITAKHVSSANNKASDYLSRLKYRQFHLLTENTYSLENRKEVPEFMWPMDKIWLK